MGLLGRIDTELGRHLFGNKSGVTGNTASRIILKTSRILGSEDKELVHPERGIIELERRLDDETVKELEEGFDRVIEKGDHRDQEIEGSSVRKIYRSTENDVTENIGEVETVIDEYKDDMESLFGSSFAVTDINFMRYNQLESEESPEHKVSRSWHFDYFTPEHVRLFILLTDVERDGGSSAFLSRDESKKMARRMDDITDRIYFDELEVDSSELDRFYGEKGSAAFAFPADHLHRGEEPDEHRDILIITFRPSLARSWIYNLSNHYSDMERLNPLIRFVRETMRRMKKEVKKLQFLK